MALYGVAIVAGVATAGIGTYAFLAAGSIQAIMSYEAATRMAVQNDLSYNDMQMAGLRGFVGGFITGAATGWAGNKIDKSSLSKLSKEVLRAFSHGTIQGVGRVIQGGKFEHGFMSGFVSSLASSASKHLTRKLGKKALGINIFIAAVSGGVAEKISGGSFANCAMTGVFVLMFNHMHDEDKLPKGLKKELEDGYSYIDDETTKKYFREMIDKYGSLALVILEGAGSGFAGAFSFSYPVLGPVSALWGGKVFYNGAFSSVWSKVYFDYIDYGKGMGVYLKYHDLDGEPLKNRIPYVELKYGKNGEHLNIPMIPVERLNY